MPFPASSRGSAPVGCTDQARQGGPRVIRHAVSVPVQLDLAPTLPALVQLIDKGDCRDELFPVYTSVFEAASQAAENETLAALPARGSKQNKLSRALHSVRTALAPIKPPADPQRETLLHDLIQQLQGKTLVSLPTFKVALDLRGSVFAERLFLALDDQKTGHVSCEQLVAALLALQHGSLEEKIAFAFSIVNSNTSGSLSLQQLEEVLQASCTEGNIKVGQAYVHGMACAVFAKAGKAPDESLTLADFAEVLKDRPELLSQMKLAGLKLRAQRNADLQAAFKHLAWYDRIAAVATHMLRAVRITRFSFLVWMLLMIMGEVAGFVAGFTATDHGPGFDLMRYSLPVAKGSAQAIKVVLLLFFFTISHSLLALLRQTPLRYIVPFDDALKFHRHLAYHFFLWSWMHSLSHLCNAARATDPRHAALWPAFGRSFHKEALLRQPTQAAYYGMETQVTGLLLIGLMTLGFLFASPWPRKTHWFRKLILAQWINDFTFFYVTHIAMTLSMVVLLMIHPYPGLSNCCHRSTTWAYMLAGLVCYRGGTLAQLFRRSLFTSQVLDIKTYSGGVTELKLSLPQWQRAGGTWKVFRYKPGQYAALQVKKLSRIEWHPFTISSAPSDDYLMFHINAAGDWTTKLHQLCQAKVAEAKAAPESDTSAMQLDADEETGLKVPAASRYKLVVHLNGPYGAPAQEYRDFNVLLLVGAGVGITPFASILRQLLHDHQHAKCKGCALVNEHLFPPHKVYLYWTVRDQRAPQYMQQMLQDIKREDKQGFLDINIHLTCASLQTNDIRSIFTLLGQSIQHEAEGFDPVTGLYVPTPCYFGRPDWSTVLSKISSSHTGSRVGVFVCGPTALSSQLKGLCNQSNAANKAKQGSTQFIFHKERF